MKKEQKIIELRRAAKLNVSELKAKIAFAHYKAAEERAGVMRERANELEGIEAGSTERFDVLAKYRAELADVEWFLADTVAQLKAEIHHVKVECEQQCAAAEDDPEPEQEQKPETEQPKTVYCDGSEHSARIVARRLINKLPHIPEGGAITVMISHGDESLSGKYWLSVTTNNGGKWPGNLCTVLFDESNHGKESEASFIDTVRESFDARKEGGDE